jgi:hypothetical protein
MPFNPAAWSLVPRGKLLLITPKRGRERQEPMGRNAFVWWRCAT